MASKSRHPKHSLRVYARLAVICVRLCKVSLKSLEGERGEFLSVLQVSDDFGSTIDRGGLFFDPEDFRANTQEHLSHEARRVLANDPSVRTDRQIGYLLIVLRNIPAFAEYPKRMQRELCRVGWYERYEPRRAIIREGHPPHSFYFILSGTEVTDYTTIIPWMFHELTLSWFIQLMKMAHFNKQKILGPTSALGDPRTGVRESPKADDGPRIFSLPDWASAMVGPRSTA